MTIAGDWGVLKRKLHYHDWLHGDTIVVVQDVEKDTAGNEFAYVRTAYITED